MEFCVWVPRSDGRYCKEKSDCAWVGGHNLQPQVPKALSFDIALKLFLFKDRSEGDSSWRGIGVMWFALKLQNMNTLYVGVSIGKIQRKNTQIYRSENNLQEMLCWWKLSSWHWGGSGGFSIKVWLEQESSGWLSQSICSRAQFLLFRAEMESSYLDLVPESLIEIMACGVL